MGRKSLPAFVAAALFFLLCAAFPGVSMAGEIFGGVSFVGDREGVCVLIEGECVEDAIYFKLDTCDADHNVKEIFKEKTPFTLRVPKGAHRLLIMKEGQKVVAQDIKVTAGEVLEIKLPETVVEPAK